MKDFQAREDRKKLRIIKNRESAQASRAKHLAYVKSLEIKNAALQKTNEMLVSRIEQLEQQSRNFLGKFDQIEAKIQQKPSIPQVPDWDSLFSFDAPTNDTNTLGSTPTFMDILDSSYLTPIPPLTIPMPNIIDPKLLISEPAVLLKSLKQMINFHSSLMSLVFFRIAPTMLIACRSLFENNFRGGRVEIIDKNRWKEVMSRKYPICSQFLMQ